jgi:hypothetical protein
MKIASGFIGDAVTVRAFLFVMPELMLFHVEPPSLDLWMPSSRVAT